MSVNFKTDRSNMPVGVRATEPCQSQQGDGKEEKGGGSRQTVASFTCLKTFSGTY